MSAHIPAPPHALEPAGRTPRRPVRPAGGLRALTRACAAGALAAGLVTGAVVPAATGAASAATSEPRSGTAVYFALSALGTPYLWGGTGAGGYDCSGLTMSAYRAAGIALPRTSRAQYAALPHVPIAKVHIGDLLFWATDVKKPETIYHVSMYVGGGMVVSAPHTGTVVQVKRVDTRNLVPYAGRPGGLGAPQPLPVLRGTRGNDVRAVQRRLRANGYAAVRVTGAYDRATYAGIASAQTRAGLHPNKGTVGTRTWTWLVQHGQTQKAG